MGKSTTAKMFVDAGIPVHDADATVHMLYENEEIVSAIEDNFPGTTDDGRVNRAELGARVLRDKSALTKLEAMIHPYVRAAEKSFVELERLQDSRIVVLDIPLLFETNANQRVDKILLVTAPFEVQKQRVLSRPGMSEEKFRSILSRQIPDAEKRAKADFIIDTSKGFDFARDEVSRIIEKLA